MSAKAMPNDDEWTTVLGLGSLLSETSSRVTFPDLKNFRLGRVANYRRIFGHSPAVFYKRGIANPETKELSSLSAEFVDGHPGFMCTVFEVPSEIMMEGGIPGEAYREREEEFDIQSVPYQDLSSGTVHKGILCVKWSDEAYIEYWGQERFDEKYTKQGIPTIWGWSPDSGLRPCRKYFQLCLKAAMEMGQECYNSFLDETFLVDRATTIRTYLDQYPSILEEIKKS